MLSGHRAHTKQSFILRLMFIICAPAYCQTVSSSPTYTSQSIVHAATQTAEALAPNAIATIYGTNLAFDTISATASSLQGSTLPIQLGGVSVTVNGYLCSLFFISPNQINFLIPYQLTPGNTTLVVARQGVAGPVVPIQINTTAPGMFVYNGFVVATHLNGTVISATAPASAGEIIVIYAVGLGWTTPGTVSGRIVTSAASISAASQMQVLLAGKACPPGNILYAGLAPGFAGLYQINLTVPPLTPPNPEIRISIGTQISPPAVQLALQ